MQEIDSQLRRGKPTPFKDLDALCTKLGLPARRTNLQSSFWFSAELPARFVNVQAGSAQGTIAIEVECVGRPDLMIEWLPQRDFKTVRLTWKPDSTVDRHRESLAVPSGATKANLLLSFAGLDADDRTVDVEQQKPRAPNSVPMNAPTRKGERWKGTGKTLGEGGQAEVSIVEDTRKEYTGQWALKRVKNIDDPKAKERFGQEVKAVQSINHPNILRISHSELTAERPYFVAEYCERGSLQKIGASPYKGDIAATREVVLPILDALVAAHKAGVFHRDVKPANILIRGDGTPVIGDFGICFLQGGLHVTLSNEGVGSRNFIAPEMESGQHRFGEPSNRTDVYSLGKVIYWMLSGGKEFAREDFPSLVDLLKDQRFEHVHRLLEQMVVRDPAKRIQSHEVKEKLETTASLVEGNFAPLAPSIGLRCRFCGLGQYERFAAYDAGDPSKSRQYPEGTSGLGLHPVAPGTNVRCLRCSHCGHVQWFQVAGIENSTWWDK
ncbi:MAG: serine/threonine protein kinase [Acidobacteriia bacterium]|nr:serine/threonine protein kinase [Terriglobia bacterium]